MSTIFDKLTNIANAIRTKTGKTSTLSLDEMATEINNISSGLNFKIVGGSTKPSYPKENTIWVNTNTPITNWIVSSSGSYENCKDGTVVLLIKSDKNNTPINVATDGTFIIYPNYVLQYISNTWVNKDIMVYMNNQWITPDNSIYWIENGIVNDKLGLSTSDTVYINPGYSYNGISTVYVFDAYSGTMGPSAQTTNTIDLTAYSTIECVYEYQYGGTFTLGAGSVYGGAGDYKLNTNSNNGRGQLILDVSDLYGPCTVVFMFNDNTSNKEGKLYIKSIKIY